MNENRHATQPTSLKPSERSKLNESYHKQKSVTATTNKRKIVLSEQSSNSLNQPTSSTTATNTHSASSDKDAKKGTKVEIPVSLNIDPFTTDEFTDPQNTMDRMLSAKAMSATGEYARARDDAQLPESTSSNSSTRVSPRLGESDGIASRAQIVKAETDLLTLKHQLVETKAELKAAEDRLREKDAIIREQESRIDELIESRVPTDDMNDVMAENARLRKEIEENEVMLADCQQLLEMYVAREK
ncbi:hypothetical protein LPJ66_005104 [Kickxella alabastrina]|uniref:Uncharacterized protein n=1 Tax=Kickxella alabastrina TaxID=61397 RepID=A0ACC1IHU2_9FUNG|nr:hypothetical protein LPJ66_005104 [Kickxella alabastrina]